MQWEAIAGFKQRKHDLIIMFFQITLAAVLKGIGRAIRGNGWSSEGDTAVVQVRDKGGQDAGHDGRNREGREASRCILEVDLTECAYELGLSLEGREKSKMTSWFLA